MATKLPLIVCGLSCLGALATEITAAVKLSNCSKTSGASACFRGPKGLSTWAYLLIAMCLLMCISAYGTLKLR